MAERFWLLADIGGTNVRLALMPSGDPAFAHALLTSAGPMLSERNFLWAETAELSLAIDTLLAELGVSHDVIDGAVIAVAGPVVPGADLFSFTNVARQFRISALKKHLGTDHVYVINDYHAQAMVIPLVRDMPDRLSTIYDAPGNAHGALGVLGAGTGLGVAALYPPGTNMLVKPNATLVVPGEGGHVALGAKVPSVQALIPHLQQAVVHFRIDRQDADQSATLRYEDVLSGPGLQCVYGALGLRDVGVAHWLSPAEIAQQAHQGNNARAVETFDLYFDTLAQACSDVAFQYLATGGIFITGGITQKNLRLLDQERFADVFTQSWQAQDLLRRIPVHVVTSEASGLSGAAAFAMSVSA